ncbi:uncharacterized protein LOC112455764 isoform X1 [Temnothorax curvispinosus]|uniref:Uncharacterized protein LOC112455764 isoform X1 n=1 Tax=Temnothorax curvispinosus TaxID=300111 RepID=A0A6J1PWT2_9HYME|nr:uncharacterized protein LOC112455764 isoform X1 [Temnothorax curvispinosus]
MADQSRPKGIDRLSEAIHNLQKSLICTICLELMTEPTKTRCGHSFCKSCIGNVLRKKSASCPLCKMSLNRRNISKDDHLQICIEKFKKLVTAIKKDSCIDILSHSKQPYDTKESCSYPDARQSSRDSNKETSSNKGKSIRQLNQNANKQTDKPSTSHGTMIDDDNPRYGLNMSKEKPETSRSSRAFSGDENDNAIHSPPEFKVRTWLHSFPDKQNTDDLIAKIEILIEDKARPMNPISDDNDESDETGEVSHDGIDASRRSNQDRKRSTDCPKRIDEDSALSQVTKGARQIGEVIEIDSDASELKYKASHARIWAKERREQAARLESKDIEETVNQGNSSSTTAHDRIAATSQSATNTSTTTEQSTANWSRVIEFGKEMKRARKRKVKKLNVSTEKNKNVPRIVENIKLSPGSKYDSSRIVTTLNKSEKEADQKGQMELHEKNMTDSSKSSYPSMSTSYITLEEGRKIHIMNLNNDQMSKIIGIEKAAEESQDPAQDLSLTPQKRLTVLTPEKLNESIHETASDVSQTAGSFRNSSCLPAEKQTPGPRETSKGTSSDAVSPQSSTPNKSRLSLRRKLMTSDNKSHDSPPLSQLPLSYRISVDKHGEDIGNRKSVSSPVSMDGKLFDRLKVVRRDLNRDFPYPVKFMQLGTLIRRRNVQYLFLGGTKHERLIPAEVGVTPVYNMQQSASRSEAHVDISFNPWNNSQNSSNNSVVKNIYLENNANSNQAVLKEFPAASSICQASATSTPKKDADSHLNREESGTVVRSSSANQQLDKSIEEVAEESARSLHKVSRADKSAIHRTISHTYPGTSKSIKLLSPDKDSQLKFLEIDSPMSEHEKLRRALCPSKSAIKGNNFSEMKSSHLAASTLDKAQEPFIESLCKKKKRMRCASDREMFVDGSSDGNDDSNDSVSSRITIKLDRGSKLSKKTRSSRLDANKKRRLSSPDDQDVEVISSTFEEQDVPEKKLKTSNSDTESTTHVTKNLKRHSDDQCIQRNASITDTTTKKCSARQDSNEDHRTQDITDKWSNEHDATRKRLKESKTSQNSVKSMRTPPEENSADHQSSRSSNAPKIEKPKNTKSSQKSSAKESDMFESSSLFNSENLDYILQLQPKLNTDDNTSKKIADSSNDDIINRVLQIDRSRSNPDACRPPGSTPRNDITRQKDSREYLLQDTFDEIIANVEQPQSEDFIPCTERSDRNPNRPSAKQKTSNCLAMTDESCGGAMQETPIVPPSSTNDMFEYHSPRNARKSLATNTSSRNSDKENVACSQKIHGYGSDQRGRKDATVNADVIDTDSHKKIVSKHNVSREKAKFLEERNTWIQSADRLHVDDSEKQRATISGNRSNSKDDTFEHDTLMNITQQQAQLQMLEEDLFGTAARNQARATKVISQNDPSLKEQRTPRKRKQNIQDKNMEPEERSADEDDVVENTPEKKMKNGNKTIESRESIKIRFLSPISRTSEWTPNTGPNQRARSLLAGANTPTKPFEMCPSSPSSSIFHSTPMVAHNSINRSDAFAGSKRPERIESGNILLAKQVDTKTLENVRRQSEKRDLCFVCSSLSPVQITTVKEFAAKYNANYVNQFDRDVTHVIVNTTGEQNAAKSTLKYLQGIAHRKWIVSYRWIEDCIRQQKLLDEIPYEATTQNNVGINGAGPRNSRLREKGLFEDFTFLCVGPYDNVSLRQYQDLLLATGATVVDSLDALAKIRGMKGVVIQDNIHDEKTIEHWYRTAKAAAILVDWIVECIGHYTLFNPTHYTVLSPQEFCAIGYPRELVEDDEESDDNDPM